MLNPDQPLSVVDAAKFLGVSVRSLHEWHRKGLLEPKFRTPGGHRRYLVRDLQEFMQHGSQQRST